MDVAYYNDHSTENGHYTTATNVITTPPMTSHIKLYGSKSSRFEEIKTSMEQQLGYEPSNPEVVGLIMAAYETEENNALQVDNALL